MNGLSQRQQDLFAFLSTYQEQELRAPSIREMCKALGVSSTNAVMDHLIALEKKGYIKRREGTRNIVILLPRHTAPPESMKDLLVAFHNKQGWTSNSFLTLLSQFVDREGLTAKVRAHFQAAADFENGKENKDASR